MKEIKLEGIIYKINLVNQLTMIFHKVNLAKQSVDLINCGSKNILVVWNIALQKMLQIVYIVIYFDLILVIKEGETHLLLKDSEIGKKKGRNYEISLGITTAHIIWLKENVKLC